MGPIRPPYFARPIVTKLCKMPQLRIVTAASATVEQMHFSLSIKAQCIRHECKSMEKCNGRSGEANRIKKIDCCSDGPVMRISYIQNKRMSSQVSRDVCNMEPMRCKYYK